MTEDDLAQLAELTRTDPAAVEKLRSDLIEKAIIRLSKGDPEKEEKFKQNQRLLEQELSKYEDPVERSAAMTRIFYEQLEEFKKALSIQATLSEAKRNADILSFPKKK